MRIILNFMRAYRSLHLTLFINLIFLNFSWAQTNSEWRALPKMPEGKWEPGVVNFENKLYLFGGYKEGVISSKRSEYFDPSNLEWTQIQELPSAITHMNMVLDKRTVWFAGGFKDGYKGHAIAEVWNYDMDLDRYTAAPLLPEPRAGGGLALAGRELHYFGGLKLDRDTDASDHWVLNLDDVEKGTAEWEDSTAMPTPRNQFSTVVFHGEIYAIGGQFNHDTQQLDQRRVDIFNPKDNAWRSGPELPKGHSHAEGATFVHENQIWMIGGHTTPTGGSKSQDRDILTLAAGGKWEKVGELPIPLSSPAAAIINDVLYVGGGASGGSSVQANFWMWPLP